MNNYMCRVAMILGMLAYVPLCCAKIAKNADLPAWTWVLRKTFNDEEVLRNRDEKSIAFASGKVKQFSQLIFSWNAMRPEQGHFRFMVQARDKATGRWGKWHTMVDWGSSVQRSYSSKEKHAHYNYVRFDLNNGHYADAFRIKVAAVNHADLSLIKSLAVNVSNLRMFMSERGRKSLHRLPSIHVPEVPKISQRLIDHPDNGGMCSPTSCAMMAAYFMQASIDPLQFASNVYDQGLGVYGSWSMNVAHAYEQCEGKVLFAAARLASFKQLHQHLERGIPVVVSVRGTIKGAPKTYDKGHLLLVVGFDAHDRKVICHDPAWFSHEETEQRYPLDSFIGAWEASRRLAYIAEPIQKG